MDEDRARERLARRVAGEVVWSDDRGATLRKWREDVGVSQTALADELGVSASVVSDYEGGRRADPGVDFVRRYVDALLDVDERRGGERIRSHARVVGAGFAGEAVLDLREYPRSVPVGTVEEAVGATRVAAGDRDRVNGHTVIDSIEAISTLSTEEFVRLYGQSTSRVLVFTGVTRGESPLVALRVVQPTPNAVILHGIDRAALWEHATELAARDGYGLAVTDVPLEALLEGLAGVAEG